MKCIVNRSILKGNVPIPGSKSHTIRGCVCALAAGGESVLRRPLDSSDTRSCLKMIEAFGAEVHEEDDQWRIRGCSGNIGVPDDIIDVGNSGTALYFGIGLASLTAGYTIFTGDNQIRQRPAGALLASISDLGGEAFSTRGGGLPPLVVKGPLAGGETSIESVTSQYLSSLLIAAPLAQGDSRIEVPLLNERPYIEMTLSWLERRGIEYETEDLASFFIKGGQSYQAFDEYIPADFSSAAFFLVAAAISGARLILQGLDFTDSQGDKAVVSILEEMGASVTIDEKSITIEGGELTGGTFDLNAIPDALPALSVAACFAAGETRLVNVSQARLKETDRITVMREELSLLGADIEELPDGLIIRRSSLKGCRVNGHHDHRVVMALAVAGLAAEGTTEIETAESVSVTFPSFFNLMRGIGADINIMNEE